VPLPDGILNPLYEFNFGAEFHYNDLSGVITLQPPSSRQILPTVVPKVDADGNEKAGVASVLHQVPLGTYTGWNTVASGFYKGHILTNTGAYIPFAKTKTERLASGDPRPSLEERYHNSHAGYVAAVKKAADNAACKGYLLAGPDAASDGSKAQCPGPIPAGFPNDWKALVDAAIASNVCNQPGDGGKCNPAAP